MLFATPTGDAALRDTLDTCDELRTRLAVHASAGPWLGRLRRGWRAQAAQSSVEIEGYAVTSYDALALASGRAVDPDDADAQALASYARAMDHVTVMADDPRFAWTDRVVLDLHFDVCHPDGAARPGRFRDGPVVVTSPEGGAPAYVGPPADEVDGLMDEVVAWLGGAEAAAAHPSVRAAMAHLHVVSVHPFRDGNGRVSRVIQSMVLAREGPLAPEFVSIEEHLGRHTADYYAALREVQGGRYLPERDALPWVRFCVDAQIAQMRRRLDQIAEAGRRWTALEALVEERAWPERFVAALQEAVLGGVDRTTLARMADVSAQKATNDLRRIVDAGLVAQRGRGPATRYVASERLRDELAVRMGDDG